MNFTTATPQSSTPHFNKTTSLPPNLLLLKFYDTFVLTAVVLFTTVITLGVVLNSLVILTVLRWPSMRTPCNYLIMNIAVADLLVALVAAPLRIIEIYVGWPFGEVMCYLISPFQDVFVTVSVITHTTIALERYRVIVTPFKPKLTLHATKIIIFVIWLLTYLTSALPYAVNLKVESGPTGARCFAVWPSNVYRRVNSIYLVAVFIAAPLIIQTLAYYRLLTNLKKMPFGRANSSNYDVQIKKRNRLVKTLVVLVALFQICYIPRGVMMLLFEFHVISWNNINILYTNLVMMILFYVKHVVNPVILFASSAEFRSHYKISGCCGDDKRRPVQESRTTRSKDL